MDDRGLFAWSWLPEDIGSYVKGLPISVLDAVEKRTHGLSRRDGAAEGQIVTNSGRVLVHALGRDVAWAIDRAYAAAAKYPWPDALSPATLDARVKKKLMPSAYESRIRAKKSKRRPNRFSAAAKTKKGTYNLRWDFFRRVSCMSEPLIGIIMGSDST